MHTHPGIRIHKIPVKGPAGLIFAIGVIVIFLMGLPEARWFLLVSLPAGLVVGLALVLWHRYKS